MVNFFHRHIDHYATKAAPLTDLLPRNKPDKLRWTDKEQNAFGNLKAALMAKPIIRPPNPEKGYVMYTDGSSVAISAVLMQTGENDEDEYVVAYASKKLTPAEKKYAIIEIELLAILFGVIIINTSMAQQWKYGQITDLSFG